MGSGRKGLTEQSQTKPKNIEVKTSGGVEWYDKDSEKNSHICAKRTS